MSVTQQMMLDGESGTFLKAWIWTTLDWVVDFFRTHSHLPSLIHLECKFVSCPIFFYKFVIKAPEAFSPCFFYAPGIAP